MIIAGPIFLSLRDMGPGPFDHQQLHNLTNMILQLATVQYI
jgi:hypothetical protein